MFISCVYPYISCVRNIDAVLKRYLSAVGQVFLRDFPFFVSFSRIKAYICRAYFCRRPHSEVSKSGRHIIEKALLTLWFWRVGISQVHND